MIQHALNHWASRRYYVIWIDFEYGKYIPTTISLSWYEGAWIKNSTPATMIRLGSNIKFTVIFIFSIFFVCFINPIFLSFHCLICYQSLPLIFLHPEIDRSQMVQVKKLKQVRGGYSKQNKTKNMHCKKRIIGAYNLFCLFVWFIYVLYWKKKLMSLITHHQQQTGKTWSPINHHGHGGTMPIQSYSQLEFKL